MSGYAVELPCGSYYHRGAGGRDEARECLRDASRFATYEGAAAVALRLGGIVVRSSLQLELFAASRFPRQAGESEKLPLT